MKIFRGDENLVQPMKSFVYIRILTNNFYFYMVELQEAEKSILAFIIDTM